MPKEATRSYQGPDTETQTYCLRTITFGLQRAAGPYRSASSAIARCVIAASPRTGPRGSRCWRSQTCISPAGHLRPPDDTRPSAPARRCELAALTRKTFAHQQSRHAPVHINILSHRKHRRFRMMCDKHLEEFVDGILPGRTEALKARWAEIENACV